MAVFKVKSLFFYLFAICLPIALLGALEGILRAFDYGDLHPLIIESDVLPGYSQPNENVIKRYFASAINAPKVSPDTQYFKTDKPTGSYRIVVQGGSTAAGFPYGRWGSLSGMLQQRFKRLYPDKNIEIINTAMASVNSYILLDFVDEIIALEPDLVLIYAGHNEYLGIMGVGSAFASKGSRATTLLYLKLKDLRLYKLIESLYAKWFETNNELAADERTLMAKVAKEKTIPMNSELFELGKQQFEGNMRLILEKYQVAEIPVLLGNLVSNEKDQIPFSSIAEINENSLSDWRKLLPSHRSKRIEVLEAQIAKGERNTSSIHFEIAQHLYNSEQLNEARQHFIQAKDLDLLRFRAPDAFNQIIDKLTSQRLAGKVDILNSLRADTRSGIIGSEHMLEHLHPTARGYFMLADAFLKQIVERGYMPKLKPYFMHEAWSEMPISKADKIYGEYKIAKLTADYPFTEETKNIRPPETTSIEGQAVKERLAGKDWLTLNHQLSPKYQRANDLNEASLIAGLLADALPNNYDLIYIAGLIYKKASNYPLSLYYFHRALEIKPESISANLSIAQSYFLSGETTNSLRHLRLVKKLQADHPKIDQLIATVEAKNRQ